jgi:ribonuclease R
MHSREQILTLIREKVHHPATARDLAQTLRITRDERSTFKRHLKALVVDGALIQMRGNRFGLPEKMDLVVGRLQTNPAGYGFVVPEHAVDGAAEAAAGPQTRGRSQSRSRDIYVAASNLTEAMHGDRVVARIERQTEKGAEGRIIRILERSHSTVVGRFEVDDAGLGYVVPFDRRVLTDVHVPTGQWSSA